MRNVVPASLRKRVLELAHEGHQGIVKTKDCLRSKVWWPTAQPQQLGIQPVEQPLVQQPVLEPATLPVPESDEIPTQGPVTEPAMEPSPQPAVTLVPEQTSEPRRRELSQAGLRTMLLERLS